jgi:hypothetical protein
MRLTSSDPEIETLASRMKEGELDLQPNFQRGEVWSIGKKQRLIDSILRDWYVPPIHIIDNAVSKKQEVLDGQQRLTAIRDFVFNEFPIDGFIEPLDPKLRELNGLYFDQLPPEWKKQVNRFPIRTFRLVDYGPSEPGELFFRLNQPSSLTSAEQRNAFFGPVRAQIKHLVSTLDGLDNETLGFSNTRMAYDDVIARVVLAVERRDLTEKITAQSLETLYRRPQPFSELTGTLTKAALAQVIYINSAIDRPIRFNKASFFSWAIFSARAYSGPGKKPEYRSFVDFAAHFQKLRAEPEYRREGDVLSQWMLAIYESRIAFRVADVSSIVLRDAVLWAMYAHHQARSGTDAFVREAPKLRELHSMVEGLVASKRTLEDILLRQLMELRWPQF